MHMVMCRPLDLPFAFYNCADSTLPNQCQRLCNGFGHHTDMANAMRSSANIVRAAAKRTSTEHDVQP